MQRQTFGLLASTLALALLLGGCGAILPSADQTTAQDTENRIGTGYGSEGSPAAPAAKATRLPLAQQQRYIIRRASLTVVVPELSEAIDAAAQLAADAGGFVSDSQLTTVEGQVPSGQLVLRVPNTGFDGLLPRLAALGTLQNRQVSGEDVTAEYIDTDARLRNLKRAEAQLLKLLDRSGKLTEILAVERELARVRGEVEVAEGRLKQLQRLVRLSTIELNLSEPVQADGNSPWNLAPGLANSFIAAQEQLAALLAAVLAGIVWFGVVGLPAVAAYALTWLVLRLALLPRQQLVNPVWFDRLWIVLGLVLAGVALPALGVVVGLCALGVGLWWFGGQLMQRRLTPREQS